MRQTHTVYVKYLLFISIAFCLFVVPLNLFAQQNLLKKANLYSSGSILLFMNGNDTKFRSELSADKKKITITIQNTTFTELPEITSNSGRIETVIFQHSGKNTIASILLREKSGFTTSLLPYSQSISVDVFDWSALSNAEENFRSGLIAFNNNILSVAKDYFNRAELSQHPNATAYSGFINIIEGNYSEATTHLEKALSRNSPLTDVYGGLTIAYRKVNNEEIASGYEKKFIDTFGRKPFFDEKLLEKQITIPNTFESSNLVFAAPVDSNTITGKHENSNISSDNIDSITHQLLQSQSPQQNKTITSIPTKASNQSLIPSWMYNGLIGISLALITVGLLLLRGFNKWKKDQLYLTHQYASMSTKTQNSFSDTLNSAITNNEVVAVNAYKAQQSTDIDSNEKESGNVEDVTESASNLELKENKLFDFDEDVYNEFEERKRNQVYNTNLSNDISTSIPETLLYQTNGKAELSANILDQQKSVLSKSIDTIDFTSLPVDDESLEHLSKQIGVDVNVLRAKQHLSTLESNVKTIGEIAKKLST